MKSRLGTVVIPSDDVATLRRHLGLAEGERLRIAFEAGPGDVSGTFAHWRDGSFDPRVTVVAYSTMFFDLIEALDAEALVIDTYGKASPTNVGNDTIRFERLTSQAGNGYFGYMKSKRHTARALRKKIESFRPHVTLLSGDIYWLGIPSLPGMKIVSMHNTFWSYGSSPSGIKDMVDNAVKSLIIQRYIGAFVCTSKECARQVLKLSPQAKVFVETPQLPSIPSPSPQEEAGELRLLYVGRMTRAKGVFDLLSVVERLHEDGVPVRLGYVGDGPVLEELRDRAAGGSARVDVHGRLPGESVQEEMARADLLVCPTREEFKEGLALVCVEALANGTPSLMSSVVPAAELVDAAGLVYAANDDDAMKAGIERFWRDPEFRERLRAAARGRSEEFTDRTQSWGTKLLFAIKHVAAQAGRS